MQFGMMIISMFKSINYKCDSNFRLEGGDTMGEWIGRIGRIRTDFFIKMHGFQEKNQKKSVCIGIFHFWVTLFPQISQIFPQIFADSGS
jgi:hypothetical protein